MDKDKLRPWALQTLEQLEREYGKQRGWDNFAPITDTEYFGPGGLLDKLPSNHQLHSEGKMAALDTYESRKDSPWPVFTTSGLTRSEALKKAILIAHLKGRQ